LATKVHLSTLDRKTGAFLEETRGEEIEEKLDISLKRLGLDQVDILHLHNQSAREGALYPPVLKDWRRPSATARRAFSACRPQE